MIQRRRLLAGAGFAAATALAAPSVLRAEPRTVKMGALRLVHSMPPYFYESFAPADLKIEIILFESPTDGKNAVLTGTVDSCTHGIAAAILGGAVGEPVVIVGALSNNAAWPSSQGRLRHQERQGPQGQEGRDLAGLDARGLHPRAAAHGGHVDQGHPADPPAVQRHAGHAGARRCRRLCRRRAGPAHRSPRRRPARRIPLLHADRAAST